MRLAHSGGVLRRRGSGLTSHLDLADSLHIMYNDKEASLPLPCNCFITLLTSRNRHQPARWKCELSDAVACR